MIASLQLATSAAIFAVAASANSGTVCRGRFITGFEREAQTAAAVLGAPTSNPAAMRIYTETTSRGHYYESNFARPGQRNLTKIVSAVPLSPRAVVENMMFVSREEMNANAAATEVAMGAGGSAVLLASPAVQFASVD